MGKRFIECVSLILRLQKKQLTCNLDVISLTPSQGQA
jgi:hypothetical protein